MSLRKLSQLMDKNRKVHQEAAMMVMSFSKSSPRKGVLFKKRSSLDIHACFDIDYIGSVDDKKSTVRSFFLKGSLISWRGKKQVNKIQWPGLVQRMKTQSYGLGCNNSNSCFAVLVIYVFMFMFYNFRPLVSNTLSLFYSALSLKSDVPEVESSLVSCLEMIFRTKYGISHVPEYMVCCNFYNISQYMYPVCQFGMGSAVSQLMI